MPTIAEVRQKFPQYEDMSDEVLADALHQKFYADLPREEFNAKIGLAPQQTEAPTGDDNWLAHPERGALSASVMGGSDVLSSGFGDELMGALATPIELGIGAFTGEDDGKGLSRLSDAYVRARDKARSNLSQGQEDHPVASTVGAIGGGVALGLGAAKAGLSPMANSAGAGLMGRVGAGLKEGAAYGGAYGFGSGEGLADSAGDAMAGAATGAVVGGAIPAIGAGVSKASKPIRDAVTARMNPSGYAARKVQERLGASGMSPQQAANRMERAPGSNLADVSGSSMRDLLRTTTNVPGPARDRVTKQLTLRQMTQGDRLKGIIKDVFADPDGFITANKKLSQAWSEVGEDVYEPALTRKVVWTDRLKRFTDEPIFQRGLAQGAKIQRLESLAAGKPFDPRDYAIVGFNDAGDPIIGGVPNMRTLNVAKKGLDAIIGDMRHPLTGKLTEEGRATDQVRRAFLAEIDRWNPDYAKARQVWGGFAKVKEALNFGQKDALGMSPEAVSESFKAMSVSEKQAARIGIAEAMRKKIDAAGYTNNALLRIFSNRQNIGVLKAAFPDQESFNTFRQSMFAEARKRASYDAVRGNSTTARQMADMAEAGGLADGVGMAAQASTGNVMGAAVQWIGNSLRRLGGLTPEVADQMARRMTASNPETVRQLTQELQRIEQMAVSSGEKAALMRALVSRAIASPTMAASNG